MKLGSISGLENISSSDQTKTESEEKMDKEEFGIEAFASTNVMNERVDDMSICDAEQDDERAEDEKKPTDRECCLHHLRLMSDQETHDGTGICKLCRKKNDRLKSLQREFADENGLETSHWSSARDTLHRNISSDAIHSLSTESPSSPVESDCSLFDQAETSKLPAHRGHSNNRQCLTPNLATHRLGSGHLLAEQKDQLSPHDKSGGQQKQQVLIQKLQGALSKMSPRIFKSTKTERPLSAVGTQDQKILALMWAKKEEEERQRSLRELSHQQWEEELKATKELSISSNRGSSIRRRRHTGDPSVQRRKELIASGQHQSAEVNSRENELVSATQTPCSAHGVSQQMACPGDAAEAEGGESENLDKGRKEQTKRDLEFRQQKSRERQLQAMEKKKSVEQRLEQQRREMEEHLLQLKRKQEKDLQRANSVRVSREQQQILRAKLKNLESQQKQEKINQMKRQSMMDLSQKEEEIRNKISQVELKAQRMKHEEARRRRDELERRIEQSRQRQEQMEKEQKKWQEELLKYQKWKDYQADGLAKDNVAKKRDAACTERIQREKLQRENMKRLLSQEEQWLNDVESSIAMKDARIKTVQKEKEEQIQRSRAIASAYQRMREELKMHYSMNDLDQVTQKMVLENRLTHKPRFDAQNKNLCSGHFTNPPSCISSTTCLDGGEILID